MPRLREFRYDHWAAWVVERVAEDRPAAIAVDCETPGLGHHDSAFAGTVTWRAADGRLVSGYFDLEAPSRIAQMRETLASVGTWVFWNAKFDLGRLDYIGALPPLDGHIIEDGQPLASLLDENRRMALKVRAVEDLGYVDTVEVEVKSGPNKGTIKHVAKEEHALAAARRKLKLKKSDGYHLLPRDLLIRYALKDTELTLLWVEKHRPLLPPDLEAVYAEEIEVIHVLREMEQNGVGLDVEYLEQAADEYGAKVMVGELRLRDLTGRDDFNANSVPQLREAFASAGVVMESTDKTAMRDLLADPSTPESARELANAVREFRDAEKIYGTYLKPLLAEQRDGVCHPWLNSTGPRTGRMSSSRASN